MSVEANTDKPHSHHATLKEIPEDDGLRNKAAPGVSHIYVSIAVPITLAYKWGNMKTLAEILDSNYHLERTLLTLTGSLLHT
jgi:hypothetical protein